MYTLSTVKNTNKNLFDCQRGFSFKVRAELLSMECKVEIDSTYICRNCCQRKRNESALHEVNIALFKRLSTRKRLPLFLTSQCNPNALLGPQPSHSQAQSTKRNALEDLRFELIEENNSSSATICAALKIRAVPGWKACKYILSFKECFYAIKPRYLKTIGDARQCTFEIYLIDHHFENLAQTKYEPRKFWSA